MTTDLTGLPALDVLIGLAFVYFLLSLVTSALAEAVAGVLNLRFRTLRRGIRELLEEGLDTKTLDEKRAKLDQALTSTDFDSMLKFATENQLLSTDDTKAVTQSKDEAELRRTLQQQKNELSLWSSLEQSPRLKALWKETGALTKLTKTGRRGPSYIPPRAFILSLLDTLAPPTDTDGHDVIKQVEKAARTVKNPLLKSWLQDALSQTEKTRDKLLSSLEGSFDGVMDRVSGWYKRYSTIWVLVFSIVIVGALNVDSYAIGSRFWKDQAVRSAVVAQVDKIKTATCSTGIGDTHPTIQDEAKCVSDLKELGLPLGWGVENRPRSVSQDFGKATGMLVTVFALMLGAPFWFDTLGKLARLRTTGKREGTAKSDERAPIDRDERRT